MKTLIIITVIIASTLKVIFGAVEAVEKDVERYNERYAIVTGEAMK